MCAALVLLMSATIARAATCTWSGGGADSKWSTSTNWTGAGCTHGPQNGDTVFFPNTPVSNYISQNDIAGLQPLSVIIQDPRFRISGAGVILGGNGLTFIGTAVGNAVMATFTAPIALNGPLTITNGSPDHSAMLSIGDINLNGAALTFTCIQDHASLTVAGMISGNGSIAVNVGNAVLSGHNTYTGPTTVALDAAIFVLDGQALGASGPGNDTVVSGELVLGTDTPITIDESITFVHNTFLEIVGPVTCTGPFSFPLVELDIESNNHLVLAGPVTGRNINALGGSVDLASPHNEFAEYVASQSTLRMIGPGAMPPTTVLLIAGGVFDLNGFDTTVGPIFGGGELRLGAATLTTTIDSPSPFSFSGPITGTGHLIKAGVGALSFDDVNGGPGQPPFAGTMTVAGGQLILNRATNPVLTGPVIVNGGSLQQMKDSAIGPASPVTVNSPGNWVLNSHQQVIGSLDGSGTVSLGVGQLVTGGNNRSTTFSGTITGTGPVTQNSFTKIGTGAMTMSGQAAFGGKVTIGAGTLIVNGTVSSPAVTPFGGTLGGTGTVGTIVATNGAISPGNSPGILHGGSLQMNAGPSSFIVELNGPAAGSGYDQLDLSGDVTLGNAATLTVSRNFGPPAGATFTIMKIAAGHAVTGTFNGLPEGATLDLSGQHFSITYKGGAGHDVVLTALEHPPAISYYLSEGATGAFFDEDVLIANPNGTDAPVTLTFSKEDGSQVTSTQTVPAQARATVHVDRLPGLEATAASAQVRSDRGLPLVVERTMFWDQSYYAGHTGSAVDRPATDWFFAEGSQGFFSTFVLVNNPNATATDVTFTFLRESDTPVTKTITVGPTTRLTLDCGSVPDILNRSFGITVHATLPIMAERSMYFGTTPTRVWSGGTESAGVTALSTHWFMAEGATGGFFDTFILLSNPNDAVANVTQQYLLDTGDTISVSKTIGAHQRLTTNIETEDDPRLHNAAVSTVVTADLPIIAERSMYWPGAAIPWGEGHNSFGVVDAGLHWGLAEGRVGGPLNFHTYILLANPQTSAAMVTVNFLREHGAPVVKTYSVPPTSRFNIDISTVTELQNESFGAEIVVTDAVPIIVERSMYWDSNGFLFSGGTNATASRLP